MEDEVWKSIPDFTNYEISNLGRVRSVLNGRVMRTSLTAYGHTKITLISDFDHERYTRSVAQMVAEAFVRPPNALSDQIVVLDGNFSNIAAENLVWRPRWYAWKYTRQLKVPQPIYYKNLHVINTETGDLYESIIEAGMTEGLLFSEIWRSTYSGDRLFPYGAIFEVTQRV